MSATSTEPPDTVRLHFSSRALAQHDRMQVEARCCETGQVVTIRTMPLMGHWLTSYGYVYVTGTNAHWQRGGAAGLVRQFLANLRRKT